jgi:hypothetical protein
MPVQLKVVDPCASDPREPAVPIEGLPTDDEALIRIWRPQAALRAEKGESEHAIARFLHSKGVEGAAARAAAREIVAHPEQGGSFGAALAKTSGIALLVLALALPALGFGLRLSGSVTIAILCGCLLAVIVACKLLWPGRGERD